MANLNIRLSDEAEKALENLVNHSHLTKSDIVKQLLIHTDFRLREGKEFETLTDEEKRVDWLRGFYQGRDSTVTTLLSGIGIFR